MSDSIHGVIWIDNHPFDGSYSGYDPTNNFERSSGLNIWLVLLENGAIVDSVELGKPYEESKNHRGMANLNEYGFRITRGNEYQLLYRNTGEAIVESRSVSVPEGYYRYYPTIRHATGRRIFDSHVFAQRPIDPATGTPDFYKLPVFQSERFKTTDNYPKPGSPARQIIEVNAGFYRNLDYGCAIPFNNPANIFGTDRVPMSAKVCRDCTTGNILVEVNREYAPRLGPNGKTQVLADVNINYFVEDPNVGNHYYPSDTGGLSQAHGNGVSFAVFPSSSGKGCDPEHIELFPDSLNGFAVNPYPASKSNAKFMKLIICSYHQEGNGKGAYNNIRHPCMIHAFIPLICPAGVPDDYANDPVSFAPAPIEDRQVPSVASTETGFAISPNPALQWVRIRLPEDQENLRPIVIYDAWGKPVYVLKPNGQTVYNLDLTETGFAAGIYFARLEQAGRRAKVYSFVVLQD